MFAIDDFQIEINLDVSFFFFFFCPLQLSQHRPVRNSTKNTGVLVLVSLKHIQFNLDTSYPPEVHAARIHVALSVVFAPGRGQISQITTSFLHCLILCIYRFSFFFCFFFHRNIQDFSPPLLAKSFLM